MIDGVVGCVCRVRLESGKVVGVFRFVEVKVGEGSFYVLEKDVPK